MSFNSILREITFTIAGPALKSATGVGFGNGTVQPIVKRIGFNVINKARMQFDNHGNATSAQLTEGDADGVYQGAEYDFESLVVANAAVTVDGVQYQLTYARKTLRNFWALGFKRLKGT